MNQLARRIFSSACVFLLVSFSPTTFAAVKYTSSRNLAEFTSQVRSYATFSNFDCEVPSPFTPTAADIAQGKRVYCGRDLSGLGLPAQASGWILAAFSEPTADILIFPSHDHYGSYYDGFQCQFRGSNDRSHWTLIYDPRSVVGNSEPFELGQYAGVAPTSINNVRIFQNLENGPAYITKIHLPTAYKYYAVGASTVGLNSASDCELNAIGSTRPELLRSSSGKYFWIEPTAGVISRNDAAIAAAQLSPPYPGWTVRLAVPESAADIAAIGAISPSAGGLRPWIGLSQDISSGDYLEPLGGWVTSPNVPIVASNWASGQPDNAGPGENYARIADASGHWEDVDATPSPESYGYIAEATSPIAGDFKPPTVSVQTSSPLNTAGWSTGQTTVSFVGSDESGISECSDPIVITEQQTVREIMGSCTDNAGNVGFASVLIGVDFSRPYVVGPRDGVTIAVMKAGTMPYQCRDDISGVEITYCELIPNDVSSADFTVPGRKIFEVRATDRAGNSTSKTFDFFVGEFSVGTIYTYAGSGDSVYSADGMPAPAIGMAYPQQVIPVLPERVLISDANGVLAVDEATGLVKNWWGSGTFPVASSPQGDAIYYVNSNEIRRVIVSGVVEPVDERVAGGGFPVYSLVPDSWKFSVSGGLAIDRKGKLYFHGCRTDSAGSQVGMSCSQLIKADVQSGAVELIAGTGIPGFSGDGGPAALAQISQPQAISVDKRGNVYFYDGSRVRRIDVNTKIITTVVELSAFPGGYGDFLGMAFDGVGNGYFLVVENSLNKIYKYSANSQALAEVYSGSPGYSGDGGPFAAATFDIQTRTRHAIAIDESGSLYIADQANHVVRKVVGFAESEIADITPPVITPRVVGAQGTNGWYVGDVEVSWDVVDSETMVDRGAGCSGATVTEDTSGIQLSCTATSSGGSATVTVTVKKDSFAPAATVLALPVPGVEGWTGPVTVHFIGLDTLSGNASCTADVRVVTEGAGQVSPEGTCVDFAGNRSASVKASGLNIDATPPDIDFVITPLANSAGWRNAVVQVSTVGVDALSGVAVNGCDAPMFLAADGRDQYAVGRCTDRAGNLASKATPAINIDRSPPLAVATALPGANGFGWNNTPVTISFDGADSISGSGVASCTSSLVLATEGIGQTVSGTCTDVAGNVSQNAVLRLNIDRTPPNVNISSPVNGGSYLVGASLIASYSCADVGSAVASCQSSVNNGAAISTASAGTFSLTVVGSDLAGNNAVSTVAFTVTSPSGSLTMTPNSLSFGSVMIGSTASLVATLRNSGSAAVGFKSIGITGLNATEYSKSSTCGTSIAAGASCTVTVVFKPSSSGTKSAVLSAVTNTSVTVAAQLSGVGVSPNWAVSPISLNFGSISKNSSSPAQRVVVTNSAVAAMPISSVGLSGTNANQFGLANQCGRSLAANSSCFVDVSFKPTTAGSKTGSLTVKGPGSVAKSVSLKGTGI